MAALGVSGRFFQPEKGSPEAEGVGLTCARFSNGTVGDGFGMTIAEITGMRKDSRERLVTNSMTIKRGPRIKPLLDGLDEEESNEPWRRDHWRILRLI
jgi:hypothetical protein